MGASVEGGERACYSVMDTRFPPEGDHSVDYAVFQAVTRFLDRRAGGAKYVRCLHRSPKIVTTLTGGRLLVVNCAAQEDRPCDIVVVSSQAFLDLGTSYLESIDPDRGSGWAAVTEANSLKLRNSQCGPCRRIRSPESSAMDMFRVTTSKDNTTGTS